MELSHDASFWCGLKGKTRPGDAHPYLVSFYLFKNEPSPDRSGRGSELELLAQMVGEQLPEGVLFCL